MSKLNLKDLITTKKIPNKILNRPLPSPPDPASPSPKQLPKTVRNATKSKNDFSNFNKTEPRFSDSTITNIEQSEKFQLRNKNSRLVRSVFNISETIDENEDSDGYVKSSWQLLQTSKSNEVDDSIYPNERDFKVNLLNNSSNNNVNVQNNSNKNEQNCNKTQNVRSTSSPSFLPSQPPKLNTKHLPDDKCLNRFNNKPISPKSPIKIDQNVFESKNCLVPGNDLMDFKRNLKPALPIPQKKEGNHPVKPPNHIKNFFNNKNLHLDESNEKTNKNDITQKHSSHNNLHKLIQTPINMSPDGCSGEEKRYIDMKSNVKNSRPAPPIPFKSNQDRPRSQIPIQSKPVSRVNPIKNVQQNEERNVVVIIDSGWACDLCKGINNSGDYECPSCLAAKPESWKCKKCRGILSTRKDECLNCKIFRCLNCQEQNFLPAKFCGMCGHRKQS
ncbi:hypothetical protein HELRODRAFT_160870 [Helobdella robusta]|uniref:RanBP2-type domain-containing protein n=1 Tax=Helobdella robusta TaxID=6412 RepID=T1EQU0_HELRO|nr:hypothetical protein HELRODRAFT_160870 [Helobdella robusta]ESO06676.1 hypothetical protein HELRODRAFT_160870 [Helobdella robusta]